MAKEETFSKEIMIGIGFGIGFFVAQAIYDELKKPKLDPSDGFGIDPY